MSKRARESKKPNSGTSMNVQSEPARHEGAGHPAVSLWPDLSPSSSINWRATASI